MIREGGMEEEYLLIEMPFEIVKLKFLINFIVCVQRHFFEVKKEKTEKRVCQHDLVNFILFRLKRDLRS